MLRIRSKRFVVVISVCFLVSLFSIIKTCAPLTVLKEPNDNSIDKNIYLEKKINWNGTEGSRWQRYLGPKNGLPVVSESNGENSIYFVRLESIKDEGDGMVYSPNFMKMSEKISINIRIFFRAELRSGSGRIMFEFFDSKSARNESKRYGSLGTVIGSEIKTSQGWKEEKFDLEIPPETDTIKIHIQLKGSGYIDVAYINSCK